MKLDPRLDDAILEQVLCRTDVTPDPDADTDDSDELFGLFIDGTLKGEDREQFLRALDTDAAARARVATYLKNPPAASIEPALAEPCRDHVPHAKDRSIRFRGYLSLVRLALAASLLIAVGAIWFSGRHGGSEALFAQRGHYLTDYNYGLDGSLVKGPTEIVGDLETADGIERGYLLLKLNRPDEALKELQKEDVDSLLGRGIAYYMQNNLKDAESVFRTILAKNPSFTAARFNLAMALQGRGQLEEALNEWNKIDTRKLPDELRNGVEERKSELQTAIETGP